MIHWCELCNEAPSEGFLEVLPVGELQSKTIRACQACVNGFDEDEWL